jgi:type II secretory pathway pseudopilin PulG
MRIATLGHSLAEILVVLALFAVSLGITLPALDRARSRAAAGAAARRIATLLHAQRWRSVTVGVAHGLLFDEDDRGWLWYEVRDGNRNGLRTKEIRDGTDPVLSGPHRLDASTPGAAPGFPPDGPFPEIPPRSGWIDPAGDPIRFGSSNLVSFGPLGTASSGRFYVTDGRTELYAIVLFGQTSRVRIWRLDPEDKQWRM